MKSEKLTEFLNKVSVFKTEKEEIQKKLNEKIKNEFHLMAQELFSEYPELKSFGWDQYTPYFNDGDPCVFRSRHKSEININGYDYYNDDEYESELIDIISKSESNDYYKEILTTLQTFLECFDSDDMYNLFGDHAKITISSEGCNVDNFRHD